MYNIGMEYDAAKSGSTGKDEVTEIDQIDILT